MKKILLFTFASFILSFTTYAQTSTRLSPEAEERCTQLTRSMAMEMRLNEIGYIQLKALNRERMALTDEVLRTHSGNEHLLDQRLREIELTYDQKVTAFLKPDQLQAFAAYKQGTGTARFVAASEEK